MSDDSDEDPVRLPRAPLPVAVWYALTVLSPTVLAYSGAVLLKKLHADQSMRGIVGLAVGAAALVVCSALAGRRSMSIVYSAVFGVAGLLPLAPLIHTATGEVSWYPTTPYLYWLASAFAGLVLGTMSAAVAMPRTKR